MLGILGACCIEFCCLTFGDCADFMSMINNAACVWKSTTSEDEGMDGKLVIKWINIEKKEDTLYKTVLVEDWCTSGYLAIVEFVAGECCGHCLYMVMMCN